MTEPTGPVYVCFDAAIQEQQVDAFPDLPDPQRLLPPSPPTAPPAAIERIARALLDAEHPVIVPDRVGRAAVAHDALVRLADLLMVPVLDQGTRHNFPNRHPMALTELDAEVLGQADYVLGLDALDLYGALHTVDRLTRQTKPLFHPSTRIAHVGMDNYLLGSWSQDFRRLQATDELVTADTSVFLPQLLERCASLLAEPACAPAKRRIEQRAKLWRGRVQALHEKRLVQATTQQGETPIALSTLALSVWNVVKDEPWVLANGNLNRWVRHLWNIERCDQYLGKPPGGGLGYGIGAAIGVALALPDRLCVNLQADGDFLFTATGLWTAVHHQVPVLNVLVNNRSYYNSEEHAATIARHRGRPVENARFGNRIEDPAVDFAKLAQSMGAYAEGPILHSEDIEPALRRALHVVKTERRPALIDVVTQNR
jgi:thiamine pyrophosphate-dependent acetolactate synthase large subunit-like protein